MQISEDPHTSLCQNVRLPQSPANYSSTKGVKRRGEGWINSLPSDKKFTGGGCSLAFRELYVGTSPVDLISPRLQGLEDSLQVQN